MSEDINLVSVSDHMAYLKLYTKEQSGSGRISPRIRFPFDARTISREYHVQVRDLTLRVMAGQPPELIGQGSMLPGSLWIRDYDAQLNIEVSVTREGIQWISDSIYGAAVNLSLDFHGTAAIYDAVGDVSASSMAQPPLKIVDLTSANQPISIARSYWYERIRQQMGIDQYIPMEIRVANSSTPGDRIRAALDHLQVAERHYVQGNDPEVLQACYAAYSSINPGDPKSIFNAVLDQRKKDYLDKLMTSTRAFTQEGRHPEESGTMAGSFDVMHADAYFALSQAKIWIAYLSKLL